MKKSLHGALLSGLLFPGLGQLWLKHYLRGIIFIIAVSASMVTVVVRGAGQALRMIERIEAEGGTVDMAAIFDVASRASASMNDVTSRMAMTALMVFWVAAVLDAYLLGRREERRDREVS